MTWTNFCYRGAMACKVHIIFLAVIGTTLLALITFVVNMYLSRKRLQRDAKEAARLNQVAEEANEVKAASLRI